MPHANPVVVNALREAGIVFTYKKDTYWCILPERTGEIRAFGTAMRDAIARFPQANIKLDPAST
jgi:hypothetical protein